MNTIDGVIYQGGCGNILICIFFSRYTLMCTKYLNNGEAILGVCVCACLSACVRAGSLQSSVVTQALDQVGYVSLGCPRSQDSGALLPFSNSASFSWLN